MYIEYEATQYNYDKLRVKTNYRPPRINIPAPLPKPELMPAKLVRIFDMTVIDSSQVNEGYSALSYVWDQSGEIIMDQNTGKVTRLDEGKHKVIHSDGSHECVKFESIIQRIYQQLNINYIWYDQLCINQDDKEEKQREIRNMHHIYENAYCTIAIVPEFNLKMPIDTESRASIHVRDAQKNLHKHQYFLRLWTLEEAINSKRLLLVGKNINYWAEHMPELELNSLKKRTPQDNAIYVNQILHHAHRRSSTKDHDRVFALANIFPTVIQHVNIDYDEPYKNLMIQLYGLLAKYDISILAFKKADTLSFKYKPTIQDYKFLPSWTGVYGEHDILLRPASSFQNYTVIGDIMHITSVSITNDHQLQQQCTSDEEENNGDFILQIEDIPAIPEDYNDKKDNYCLGVSVQLSSTSTGTAKTIQLSLKTYNDIVDNKDSLRFISKKFQQLSRFIKVKKENICWHYIGDQGEKVMELNFNWLTEDVVVDDSCIRYRILSEIPFEIIGNVKYSYFSEMRACSYYPVIKKNHKDEFYKAIGLCITKHADSFFTSSGCNFPKQTFSIQ